MPISNAPFFKYAFAQSGDKTTIPQDQDPQGRVSYQQGFGGAYSKDPAADGYPILRDNFNQLMFDTTNAIRQLQINGGNLWSAEIATNGGYPAGAVVLVKMQMNGVVDSGGSFTQNLNYYQPVVSMKDANTDEPTTLNLLKSWWALDGNPLFGVITRLSNAGLTAQTPSGYLEIGGANPSTKYNFSDYPRIQRALTSGYGSEYFRNNGDNTFSIVDLRGRFPRLWSNGGSIDSGRAFNALQGDAIRELQGTFTGVYENCSFNISGAFVNKRRLYGDHIPDYSTFRSNASFSLFFSDTLPVSNEIRPHNFNMRMFIKV